MWNLSSTTRNQTHVPRVARQILNPWTTREVPLPDFLKQSSQLTANWYLHQTHESLPNGLHNNHSVFRATLAWMPPCFVANKVSSIGKILVPIWFMTFFSPQEKSLSQGSGSGSGDNGTLIFEWHLCFLAPDVLSRQKGNNSLMFSHLASHSVEPHLTAKPRVIRTPAVSVVPHPQGQFPFY